MIHRYLNHQAKCLTSPVYVFFKDLFIYLTVTVTQRWGKGWCKGGKKEEKRFFPSAGWLSKWLQWMEQVSSWEPLPELAHVAEAQALGTLSAAFPGNLAESWTGSAAGWSQTGAHMGCQHHRQGFTLIAAFLYTINENYKKKIENNSINSTKERKIFRN